MIMASLIPILPEIFVALGSLSFLMVGVFQKKQNIYPLFTLTILLLGIVLIGLLFQEPYPSQTFFQGQFIQDSFSQILKITIVFLGIFVLLGTTTVTSHQQITLNEYPILFLLSLLGMMIMISAGSFLSLFVGLELQSLSLYILVSLRRNDPLSSESGMKYFILGALSTGLLLYGISLIYGTTGTVRFDEIQHFMNTNFISSQSSIPIGLIIGVFFIIAGIAFKISAAPFHMWTPDVYEGAPSPVTLFLATIPKIAAFALLVRILMGPFFLLLWDWNIALSILSVLSMCIGFFGLLAQRNLKRLIAYSSIANAGFGLLGLVPGSIEGIQATLIYFILYSVTILGFFLCLLFLIRQGKSLQTIDDLAGISKLYPGLTFCMALFLFSLAGVPPLAGFLGKLYIFKAALIPYSPLVLIALLTSVVGAGYYLWIIKIMTMDKLNEHNWKFNDSQISFTSEDRLLYILIMAIVTILIWFFLTPNVMTDYAHQAAQSFPIFETSSQLIPALPALEKQ